MSFKIVASEHFGKQLKKLAKKYPSIKQDLISLREELNQNPFQGSPLGKNCYKVRMSIASKIRESQAGPALLPVSKLLMMLCTFFQYMTKVRRMPLTKKNWIA